MITPGTWKGQQVDVESAVPCPVPGHRLEVIHHLGDDGRHWCPTGILFCYECLGAADEPEPYECTLSGKRSGEVAA